MSIDSSSSEDSYSTSSISSLAACSCNETRYTLRADFRLNSTKKSKFLQLFSRLEKLYNHSSSMSTETIQRPSVFDRYLFPSPPVTQTKPRRKFIKKPSNSNQTESNVYKFPAVPVEYRPTLQESEPYCFSRTKGHHYYSRNRTITPRPYLFDATRPRILSGFDRHLPKKRMDTVMSTNETFASFRRSPNNKPTSVRFNVLPNREEGISFTHQARERLMPKKRSKHSNKSAIKRRVPSTNNREDSTDEITSQSEGLPDFQVPKRQTNRTLDWKSYERSNRNYLRWIENESLQRELNSNLIRSISSSYLVDLRREELRYLQRRSRTSPYTFEDIQDLHVGSIFNAYKMKNATNRERRSRSVSNTSSLTIDMKSSSSMKTSSIFPSDPIVLDTSDNLFYEVIQEMFRGIDASIAGHISKASRYVHERSHLPQSTDSDHDIDIKSSSSFWSDDEIDGERLKRTMDAPIVSNQRQISRFLSTVNQSLLDHPSGLIADFFISRLNRNMQESVRCIEILARDRAQRLAQSNNDRRTLISHRLERSFSAEQLFQVRKEQFRYRQNFQKPASFTAEDVADIYKPFALENYKRKIAIELERRRREGQSNVTVKSSPLIETEHSQASKKLDEHSSGRERIVISPPLIFQNQQIVMGRARRSLNNDGAKDIVHHLGLNSVPLLYEAPVPINESLYSEVPKRTRIAPSDLDGRQSPLSTITSHRPKTKIYTQGPSRYIIPIDHARCVQSDGEEEKFSFASVHSIPLNESKPKEQHQSKITIPIYSSIVHQTEENLVYEHPTDMIHPTLLTDQARATTQLPPLILHLSVSTSFDYPPRPMHVTYDIDEPVHYETIDDIYLDPVDNQARVVVDQVNKRLAERASPDEFQQETNNSSIQPVPPEQLAEYVETAIGNETPDVRIKYPEKFNAPQMLTLSSASCASLVEQLISKFHEQNAREIFYSPSLTEQTDHEDVSTCIDLEKFIERFEKSYLDPQYDLPLVDQVSFIHGTQQIDVCSLSLNSERTTMINEALIENCTLETDLNASTDMVSLRQLSSSKSDDNRSVVLPALVTHCSPTSDYETDSLDKDNEPLTMTTSDLIKTPMQTWSSSLNRNYFSSSTSQPTSSSTVPVVPVVYFLDALATVDSSTNKSLAKQFLATIGFGESMNSPSKTATWITRSVSTREELPTIIHEDPEILLPSKPIELNYAEENQVDEDETATIIHPFRLQFGQTYDNNTQEPLKVFYEPAFLHLPIVNEVTVYQINSDIRQAFHFESTKASIEIEPFQLNSGEDQVKQSTRQILAYPKTEENKMHDSLEAIPLQFEEHSFVDHYRVQPLNPFGKDSSIRINEPLIIHDVPRFAALLMKDEFHTLDSTDKQSTNETLYPSKQSTKTSTTSKMTDDVETVRPSESIYTDSILRIAELESERFPEAQSPVIRPNPGAFQPEISLDTSNDEVLVRDTVVEHVSEDEKSTSSEEVVFEEWSEEFRCRRTDEFDGKTNRLIRTRIDQTSAPIKSDVVKEEYKEKHQRIKGRKRYDVIKEVFRRVPAKTADPKKIVYEENSRKPPQTSQHGHTWSNEENYVTEIVRDDRTRQDIQSTISSKSPAPLDPVITEEYCVEIEQEGKGNSSNFNEFSRDSANWQNYTKQTHDDSSSNQDQQNDRTQHFARRVSVIPATQPQRFKQVEVKRSLRDRTSNEQRQTPFSPTSRRNVKEVLVCVTRGASPEKTPQYFSSAADREKQKKRILTDSFQRVEPTVTSSIDSDLKGPSIPIYQSTPKSVLNRYQNDRVYQSRDELDDANKQNPSTCIRRDLSQTTSTFDERDSGIFRTNTTIGELTKQSTMVPGKFTDSGIYDRSKFTGSSTGRSPTSWRQDLSTSIVEDPTVVIETPSRTPYSSQTITTKKNDETYSSEQTGRPPQTAMSSIVDDYENLTSYRSSSQSRPIKPLVVDEIETIETETRVECQVDRKNQTEERLSSKPMTHYTRQTPTNEQMKSLPSSQDPPIQVEQNYVRPIGKNRGVQRYNSTLQITPLCSPSQITFGKQSDREMIAILRIPELSNGTNENTDKTHQRRYSHSSRANQPENASQYSSSLIHPQRSASSHSNSYERRQQLQLPSDLAQIRKRPFSGSHGNLLASQLGFEIEIEKRPPTQPSQPTVVAMDQATRAVVTTSRDGRVTIENLAVTPGNTVVIHSDFHASDRSSGYVSADEIRSQPYIGNDSSDDQSKSSSPKYLFNNSSNLRRYRNTDGAQISKLPSYYHPKATPRSTDKYGRVNEMVHHYNQRASNNQRTDFHEAIDQIDALYSNLNIQTKVPTSNVYDFSRPTSTINRRKQLAQNPSEYSKRYTSTGFQQISSTDESQRPLSDPESAPNENHRQWASSSLTDLVQSVPIQPSQSLSSSGILADYLTPGSISPNSGYGSTQDIVVQQNRYNDQAHLVRRNRTVTKQRNSMKRSQPYGHGLYSADDDDDDENESPVSDNGSVERRSPASSRSFNYYP